MNRYHNLNIYGHIALELGADNDLSGSTSGSHNVPTADISFLRFTGTNPTVSGFADGSDNNKILIVSFVPDVGAESGGVFTLKHESSYSNAGNRIKTNDGNDLVLNPYESAFLLYDSYDTVWRVISSPTAAGGGGGGTTYGVHSFGEISTSSTLNLSNIDEGSGKFSHTNASSSTITLSNGTVGKSYRIFAKSNGVQYSFAAASSGTIVWPTDIIPVISANNRADLWIFECFATNKYIARYINNYDPTGIF
jgi:hypothetical protein